MGQASLGYFGSPGRKRGNAFPRRMLFGMAGLLAFAVVAVVFGQSTGIGTVTRTLGQPAAVRDIVIARTGDGGVIVRDGMTGGRIATYANGEGGFVAGSVRALERMRLVSGVPMDTPYRLIRWETGMVTLSDTATGERLYLDPFGKDNAAAFALLLEHHGGTAP